MLDPSTTTPTSATTSIANGPAGIPVAAVTRSTRVSMPARSSDPPSSTDGPSTAVNGARSKVRDQPEPSDSSAHIRTDAAVPAGASVR